MLLRVNSIRKNNIFHDYKKYFFQTVFTLIAFLLNCLILLPFLCCLYSLIVFGFEFYLNIFISLWLFFWFAYQILFPSIGRKFIVKGEGGKFKSVCIIGAGPVGLAAIKEVKAVGITDIDCFEIKDKIGGVYYFSNKYFGGVSKNTRLTSSNWVTAFSDFKPKDDDYKHWSHQEYLSYLCNYVKTFELSSCIKLEHSVEDIEDFETHFIVKTKNLKSGKVVQKKYDRVIVCTGLNMKAKEISFSGIEKFQGDITHIGGYKDIDKYKCKNVVIVGNGESAVDIAADISKVAIRTYLSVRRGTFIIPRVNPNTNLPNDFDSTRARYAMDPRLASLYMSMRRYFCFKAGHMDKKTELRYNFLKTSKQSALGQTATKSDDFLKYVENGSLKIIGELSHIESCSIKTIDSKSHKADCMIFAHGFQGHFPFLQNSPTLKSCMPGELYLNMFHPEMKDRIVFLGFVRPSIGSIPPVGEIQARLIASLFSGKKKINELFKIESAINDEIYLKKKLYPGISFPHNVVNWIPYMDKVSRYNSDFKSKLKVISRPLIWWHLITAPVTGMTYRVLEGKASRGIENDLKSLPKVFSTWEFAVAILINIYSFPICLLRSRALANRLIN